MGLGGLFGHKKSANIAHERLRLTIARERDGNGDINTPPPYFEAMKKDIIEVIKRYTNTQSIEIKNHNVDTLEVEITLEKNSQ
ncbi:cell division topological specificity factor MinE [Helicobacter monodelphidis]|uniref:cell division topological specificity factor MinE n=1 Tax=Helicobacter sp. 15-1451 TaxID=2004995 RepID=UPI000DCB4C15|nr:cell division topological specificity factor MinE [Helicobacter sp. 15-1451]RAX59351.1 cell division topological specificity factor MinE [Helicobacter sp. 15-1451]